MTKKYYAVKSGRKTGVFETWDECNKQVKGFKGAIFKSFKNFKEAESYLSGSESTNVSLDKLSNEELIAYVDGSFNIETSEIGYGIVLLTKDDKVEISKKISDKSLIEHRNVSGEIHGSMVAINYAIENSFKKIYIYFDYMGIKAWAEGDWKTNHDLTTDYKKFIDEKKSLIDIKFVKVKAHSNDKYNDLADRLAKNAIGIK